ncbi:MAG: hypothetical protein D6681_00885 [Calditrichaeota bacterium]|nr:MAG: hypothetical protein D6681_00885 [Calditrichota bacterium]
MICQEFTVFKPFMQEFALRKFANRENFFRSKGKIGRRIFQEGAMEALLFPAKPQSGIHLIHALTKSSRFTNLFYLVHLTLEEILCDVSDH